MGKWWDYIIISKVKIENVILFKKPTILKSFKIYMILYEKPLLIRKIVVFCCLYTKLLLDIIQIREVLHEYIITI